MAYHKNLRGADLHAPSAELVENQTGSTVTKLKVVTLDGMGSVYPKIRVCNSSIAQDFPFGVTQADILTGKAGYITCLGFMFELDTSAWPVGTILYGDSTGTLTTSALGSEIAEVVKSDATNGILYVLALGAFIADTGGSSYWATNGNIGLAPSTFLGTVDAIDLNIRTNNLPVAKFDTNGRLAIGSHSPDSQLHLKSYPNYSASGLRTDTFALTSDVTALVPSYTLNMVNGQVARIKYQVTARQSDGAERASFTRSMLIYKQAGNVLVQGSDWTSDFTIKSTNGFDIGYTLGVSGITFHVQNANSIDTYWAGHIEVEIVGSAI